MFLLIKMSTRKKKMWDILSNAIDRLSNDQQLRHQIWILFCMKLI